MSDSIEVVLQYANDQIKASSMLCRAARATITQTTKYVAESQQLIAQSRAVIARVKDPLVFRHKHMVHRADAGGLGKYRASFEASFREAPQDESFS